MANYWHLVPRGIWTITDPTDALNALMDRDSLPEYDPANFRIHILGPTHKAVILDLTEIFKSIGNDFEFRKLFIDSVRQVLKIQLN